MRIIILAFLIFTSLALTYHETVIGYSGDKSGTVDHIQHSNTSQQLFQEQPNHPKALHNWKFVHKKSDLGGASEWIKPQSSKQINPSQWQTTYAFKIVSLCTKNPVNLKIASTGVFEIYLNDKLIQGQHKPWPEIIKIPLYLKCGENSIKIVVLNKDPTPAAIIYLLTQNTHNCFKCKDFQTFNNQTCNCECHKKASCPANKIFNKKSCKCSSICPKHVKCPKGKKWDTDTCQCNCQNTQGKCQGEARWDADTCSCFCLDKLKCKEGLHWDEKLCKCVSSQSKEQDKKTHQAKNEASNAHQFLNETM